MRPINKIIIHCSATPEDRDVKTETIRGWHLDRGFSDLGYHFVIELDGMMKKGRPLEVVGAHVRGQNNNSIGICYVGGVDEQMKPKNTLDKCQEEQLIAILKWLKEKFPKATVHGHNEFTDSKACPSFNVQKWLVQVGLN